MVEAQAIPVQPGPGALEGVRAAQVVTLIFILAAHQVVLAVLVAPEGRAR